MKKRKLVKKHSTARHRPKRQSVLQKQSQVIKIIQNFDNQRRLLKPPKRKAYRIKKNFALSRKETDNLSLLNAIPRHHVDIEASRLSDINSKLLKDRETQEKLIKEVRAEQEKLTKERIVAEEKLKDVLHNDLKTTPLNRDMFKEKLIKKFDAVNKPTMELLLKHYGLEVQGTKREMLFKLAVSQAVKEKDLDNWTHDLLASAKDMQAQMKAEGSGEAKRVEQHAFEPPTAGDPNAIIVNVPREEEGIFRRGLNSVRKALRPDLPPVQDPRGVPLVDQSTPIPPRVRQALNPEVELDPLEEPVRRRLLIGTEEVKQTGSGRTIQGLYNTQIDIIMQDYRQRGYLGCVSADEVHLLSSAANSFDRISFIMNLSKSYEEGSHWVAVYIDFINDKSINYFDSYGDEPDDLFLKQIKEVIDARKKLDYYLKLKYNLVKNQRDNSNICGFLAIQFLMDMYSGMSFKKATHFEQQSHTEQSEKRARRLNKRFGYLIHGR